MDQPADQPKSECRQQQLPPFADAVLELVERVPAGHAISYGEIAAYLASNAREVGRVMTMYGAAVPWWRVVRADGSLPPKLVQDAMKHYQTEKTPLRAGGRVDMRRAAWLPEARHPAT